MLIRQTLLILLGLVSGAAVAAGVFAFITVIGVIPRMAAKTETAKEGHIYEKCIAWGGILGNAVSLFQWNLPLGYVGILAYGLFSGVFIGSLSAALAEVLKAMPVLIKRTRLRYGLPWIIVMMGLGKMAGSLYQLLGS